jgi:flagellar hook protein FlgE
VLTTNGNIGDISITAVASQSPTATTQMTLDANLDASAPTGTSFSTPLQVVDSLGVTHVLTYTFAKTGPNAWSYDVSIPGEDLTGGTAGTPTSLASGSLAFDAAGNLTTPPAGTPVNVKTTTGLVSGANDLDMNWSLYAPDGTSLVTQFAQTSAASATTQDGVQAAQLTGIKLGDGGTLMATFSSGKQVAIAQIALAAIGNPDSLISVGNNNFQVGTNTLTPTVGLPNTGNRGTILGGSLESSNVDLAREFTNLIIYQRGYQANAKVITSQDQIDQVLLNIKQ